MDDAPLLNPRDGEALLHCACITTRTAARSLTRLYDEALAPSGIRITQLGVLAAVAFHGPFTMKVLAEALVMDRTTLTADLRPLEAQGFVTLAPGSDRRTRIVTITSYGQAAIQRALPLWRDVQQRITEGFGVVRFSQLVEELQEVTALGIRR